MIPSLTSIIGKPSGLVETNETTFPLATMEGFTYHDIATFPSATNLSITHDGNYPDLNITISGNSIDFNGKISGIFNTEWGWKNHKENLIKYSHISSDVEIENSDIIYYQPDTTQYKTISFTITGTAPDDTGLQSQFTVTVTKYIVNDWANGISQLKTIIENQRIARNASNHTT